MTEVTLPSGGGDPMHHVWRHRGSVVQERVGKTEVIELPDGGLRLLSRLLPNEIPTDPVGQWYVEVVSEDGRLVGRIPFSVIE